MLKYLVPLLFLSSVALADDNSAPHVKLWHHFDPLEMDNGGWNGTQAPSLPKAIIVPTNLGGKCSTDDLKTISEYLHSIGYTALLVSNDKNKPEILREVMYNLSDNSVLGVSLIHEKPLVANEDESNNKILKICLDYQGVSPYGDGPTFKKFVLGQHMDLMNKVLDAEDKQKRKMSSSEEDGHGKGEPYQGDPSRVRFIP